MLREPVELVISTFLFHVWRAEHLQRMDPPASIIQGIRKRGWGLKDIYREFGGARERVEERHVLGEEDFVSPFFNWQTRHILLETINSAEIPFEAGGEGLRKYRDMVFETLSERYVVGTQDRYSQSVRLFADTFGWRRVFVPRANVGGLRGREEELGIDDETRELIRQYNQVDVELHAHYSERLRDAPLVGRMTDVHGRGRRSLARAGARARRRASRLKPT